MTDVEYKYQRDKQWDILIDSSENDAHLREPTMKASCSSFPLVYVVSF